MDRNTTRNIRNILASNFGALTSAAMHGGNFPRQIKVERLERTEVACITTANFAYQIGAIDAQTYSNLRTLVQDVTDSVKNFRRNHSTKNSPCGNSSAIFTSRLAIKERVFSLRAALDQMKHDDASTAVNA